MKDEKMLYKRNSYSVLLSLRFSVAFTSSSISPSDVIWYHWSMSNLVERQE
jgi:hypothetical protein